MRDLPQLTVGRLKDILKDFPDNMLVGIGAEGAWMSATAVELHTMKVEYPEPDILSEVLIVDEPKSKDYRT